MKVYELLNKLKGTNSNLEQIKQWSYMNRIPPCNLEDGLELDCEFPESLNRLIDEVCAKSKHCQAECLETFFEMEVDN